MPLALPSGYSLRFDIGRINSESSVADSVLVRPDAKTADDSMQVSRTEWSGSATVTVELFEGKARVMSVLGVSFVPRMRSRLSAEAAALDEAYMNGVRRIQPYFGRVPEVIKPPAPTPPPAPVSMPTPVVLESKSE